MIYDRIEFTSLRNLKRRKFSIGKRDLSGVVKPAVCAIVSFSIYVIFFNVTGQYLILMFMLWM